MQTFALIYLALCLVYLLLDLQLLRGLRRLEKDAAARPPEPSPSSLPSITVLIAARDEEHNLPRVLKALLAQDYPRDRMQIVVVNDRSSDGTEALLREHAARHPDLIETLTVAAIPEGWAPKKHALLRGLERARGEWIAMTDADSEMSPQWLSSLARDFGETTGMVLGLTVDAVDRGNAGEFSTAQGVRALEFAAHGITGSALVGLGFPVIANANNLAYRRRAFEEAGAFGRHGSVVSGDDDFTLQEIHATGKWKVRFATAPGALMRTGAPSSWRPFWEQRKRWASKCIHYRPQQAIFLAGVFAFYLSMPVLLLAGVFSPPLAALGFAAFLIKTLGDYAVMRAGLRLFGLTSLLRFFPLTALLHVPLILGAVVAGTLGGFTWKGQRLGRKMGGR
jgi:cellulose synthase/poly-beta-1,6-N-acetylglucosamine synthase-like glycosyltransferase